MDRDDSLMITGNLADGALVPSAAGVAFDKLFGDLPRPVKMEVLTKGRLMIEIAKAKKVLPACREIAARLAGQRGMSAERLSDLYYRWQAMGPAALIDHRKCDGCGAPGCTQARKRGLPQAVIEFYWARCGKIDKNGLQEGWEKVIKALCSSEPLMPGLTWQTLHIDLFPGLSLPKSCPWSVSHPPPGWSASTFFRHKPTKAIYKAIQKGGSAAWNETPDVRMDLTQLRFLEAVVFDDHRLDFEVMVWDDKGKVQIVEMWGLFAMDVSTGAVIAFGLRPKLQRADGTTEGLTMRDMQHLIAHILATYGYPTKYQMQLIVENAAAAVSAHTEMLVGTRSHGQVVVRRTGVHAGDLLVRGFPERWGGPRGKAWLESWFNILDIVLGDVKGQMGSNYIAKPGDHDGRVRMAEKVAAIISARPDLQRKLSAPLHWAGEAHLLVTAAINEINGRTDHVMTRHEEIVEWRWSEGDTAPKPMMITPGLPAHIEREILLFQKLPAEVRQELINNYGAKRMESPREKVQRIYRPSEFVQIPADTYLDLMMDSAKAIYKGGDVLDLELGRGNRKVTMRFAGNCDSLMIGQEVTARFNSDRPDAGVWLHNEREVFIGHLAHQRDPRMLCDEDLPLLQSQLGAKIKAHTAILNEARRVVSRLPETRQEMTDRDRDLATLSTLALPKPTNVAPALPESTALSRNVMNTKRVKAAEPISDAEAYLALLGEDNEK